MFTASTATVRQVRPSYLACQPHLVFLKRSWEYALVVVNTQPDSDVSYPPAERLVPRTEHDGLAQVVLWVIAASRAHNTLFHSPAALVPECELLPVWRLAPVVRGWMGRAHCSNLGSHGAGAMTSKAKQRSAPQFSSLPFVAVSSLRRPNHFLETPRTMMLNFLWHPGHSCS
jgi:hypothetical protein